MQIDKQECTELFATAALAVSFVGLFLEIFIVGGVESVNGTEKLHGVAFGRLVGLLLGERAELHDSWIRIVSQLLQKILLHATAQLLAAEASHESERLGELLHHWHVGLLDWYAFLIKQTFVCLVFSNVHTICQKCVIITEYSRQESIPSYMSFLSGSEIGMTLIRALMLS